MTQPDYLRRFYPQGKADLSAAFMMRSLDLARDGGMFALLTMRGWMFVNQFTAFRAYLFSKSSVVGIGDVDRGAFAEVFGSILAVSMTIARKGLASLATSYVVQPTPLGDVSSDRNRTARKRAAVLVQRGVYKFSADKIRSVPGAPVIYWWPDDLVLAYSASPKLEDHSAVRTGLCTSDNVRFLRKAWEIGRWSHTIDGDIGNGGWAYYVSGAKGLAWIDPCDDVCAWRDSGVELKSYNEHLYTSYSRTVQNVEYYFVPGIAFSMIGSEFRARAHRRPSIMGKKGSSVFPSDLPQVLCLLNAAKSRYILQSLNPGIGFEVGDVNRLPVFSIEGADAIYARLDAAFTEHEAARENSVEFRSPGPSAWRYAQDWAQRAVDRPAGEPLPEWTPDTDPPAPVAFVSFALGVALGRFAADGSGIVDEAPATALPHGLLFLSAGSRTDGLDHPACAGLRSSWAEQGGAVKRGAELRDWLRLDFFKHHKALYENRSIWLPLSSAKRSFVVFAAIHRWHDGTLDEVRVLLKDERKVLDGELEDVKHARATGDAKARGAGEKRQEELRALLSELDAFTAKVEAVSERGAPPAPGGKPRGADARFVMDLDDGVMVNAAALWPLLDPQWKDPVKWWKELCDPKGRKDYDWSHLAARYFPARVDGKCKTDPSLAVAHGCFWRYHPARAYAWELRLQDEIGPDFLIREAGSDDARTRFLEEQPDLAREIEEKEQRRRERKAAKASADSDDEDGDADDSDAEADQTEES